MKTTEKQYAIVCTRSFYSRPDVRSRHTNPHDTWPTLAAARAEIGRLDSSIYYQDHNEYGRAQYKAVALDRLPKYLR